MKSCLTCFSFFVFLNLNELLLIEIFYKEICFKKDYLYSFIEEWSKNKKVGK